MGPALLLPLMNSCRPSFALTAHVTHRTRETLPHPMPQPSAYPLSAFAAFGGEAPEKEAFQSRLDSYRKLVRLSRGSLGKGSVPRLLRGVQEEPLPSNGID